MRPVQLSPDQEFFTYSEARLLVAMGMLPGEDAFKKNPNLTTYMPVINSALREAVERGTVTLRDPQSLLPLPIGALESHTDRLAYDSNSVIQIPKPLKLRPDPVLSRADFERFCKSLGVDVQIRDENDCDAPSQVGYTIRGAAKALAKKYAIPARAMRDSIVEAVKQGTLRVRSPKTGMPHNGKMVLHDSEHRVSIADLNEWLKNSGVEYELEGEHDDRADMASSARGVSGSISRNEVMRVFRVRPNELDNKRYWDDKLGRPPLWLKDARLNSGKRGVSARWDPILVAHALLQQRAMALKALDSAIHAHFSESFEKWEEETGDERS